MSNSPTQGAEAEVSASALDAICNGLREGRTLSAICRRRTMPSRAEVMRWCDISPEAEQRLLEARQTGIWALLDDALDRLAKPKNAEFTQAKEFASHVRWLAGKLMVELPTKADRTRPRKVEICWLDALPEAEREKYRENRNGPGL